MKRILCLLLLLAIALGCCSCAKQDEDMPASEHDDMVKNAVDVLKKHWTEEIYLSDDNYGVGDGYLQIVNTRVIDIKDEPDIKHDIHIFDDVDYVVEFILFGNYFYTAPFYWNAYGQNSHVVVYKDGTMEVTGFDPFDQYRGMTYSSDFTGIIEEVTDLGDKYNAVYIQK